MAPTRLTKIVSGGQTGADRAALDTARRWNVAIGGWVPRGRLDETGVIPEEFVELREAGSAAWDERTRLNVRDSDGTLVVSHGPLTGGSVVTLQCAAELEKPFLHLDLTQISEDDAVQSALAWVRANEVATLNVAGPRASEDPRAYEATAAVVSGMLRARTPSPD